MTCVCHAPFVSDLDGVLCLFCAGSRAPSPQKAVLGSPAAPPSGNVDWVVRPLAQTSPVPWGSQRTVLQRFFLSWKTLAMGLCPFGTSSLTCSMVRPQFRSVPDPKPRLLLNNSAPLAPPPPPRPPPPPL